MFELSCQLPLSLFVTSSHLQYQWLLHLHSNCSHDPTYSANIAPLPVCLSTHSHAFHDVHEHGRSVSRNRVCVRRFDIKLSAWLDVLITQEKTGSVWISDCNVCLFCGWRLFQCALHAVAAESRSGSDTQPEGDCRILTSSHMHMDTLINMHVHSSYWTEVWHQKLTVTLSCHLRSLSIKSHAEEKTFHVHST